MGDFIRAKMLCMRRQGADSLARVAYRGAVEDSEELPVREPVRESVSSVLSEEPTVMLRLELKP